MEKEGKVIYFPLKYNPNMDEWKELDELQFMIKFTIQQIEHVENNSYNLMVRKQGLANSLRNKIQLVDSANT